ncbi:Hypothetical predicted protein [Pelobates cultripes]|uniref:Uncharacterized protein n=1 Tax=Pelobates cultripes TaxID=61616 RepID=A0AAD1RI88_PELCU|nr:Hypothetical predicted protein [Pelobates cultripes]
MPSSPQMGTFYVLPKIHKQGNPGRPIITVTQKSIPTAKANDPSVSLEHTASHPSDDDLLSSHDFDGESVEMHYNASPSEGIGSEDEAISECPELMTTTPIIQSTEKLNMAKHPFGTPGIVKASDSTIMQIKELCLYESYLDAMRYVEANPPEDTANQVSTCSCSQPLPTGEKPMVSRVVKYGLIKRNNDPILTLGMGEKYQTVKVSSKPKKKRR